MESFSGHDMQAKPLRSRTLGIVYFCVRALVALEASNNIYSFILRQLWRASLMI